jgi:hypothetical protein
MYRKIISWAFIIIGTLLLVLSVAGVAAIWIYRVPARDRALAQLKQVDVELTQAQTALDNGRNELQRTLRIVDAADKGLSSLKQQLADAKKLTDQVNGVLNTKLTPGLQGLRDKLSQLRGMLQNLRDNLKTLNAVPFLNLNIPGDQYLAGLIADVDNLDKELVSIQQLTAKASTFVGDSSYLMGGNLTDTRVHIQDLLKSVTEYDKKVAGWHAQLRDVIGSLPRWINEAAVGLTLFLLWLGISQFGLVLHGLGMQQGDDPLLPLRRLRSRHDEDQYVD